MPPDTSDHPELSNDDTEVLQSAVSQLSEPAVQPAPKPRLPRHASGKPTLKAFDFIRQPSAPKPLTRVVVSEPKVSLPVAELPSEQLSERAPLEDSGEIRANNLVTPGEAQHYEPDATQHQPNVFDTNHYHQPLPPDTTKSLSRSKIVIIGVLAIVGVFLLWLASRFIYA